jgi:hypothetical protein
MLYLADVPTETLRMPLSAGAVPALAVPQYWQRAAGFVDMLIAHAESKQRVKFAREHVVAPNDVPGISRTAATKYKVRVFISLYIVKTISKILGRCKEKNCYCVSFYLSVDKSFLFV